MDVIVLMDSDTSNDRTEASSTLVAETGSEDFVHYPPEPEQLSHTPLQ